MFKINIFYKENNCQEFFCKDKIKNKIIKRPFCLLLKNVYFCQNFYTHYGTK